MKKSDCLKLSFVDEFLKRYNILIASIVRLILNINMTISCNRVLYISLLTWPSIVDLYAWSFNPKILLSNLSFTRLIFFKIRAFTISARPIHNTSTLLWKCAVTALKTLNLVAVLLSCGGTYSTYVILSCNMIINP